MDSRKITVYVNDKPVEIWNSFMVEHAVLEYDLEMYKDVKAGRAWMEDAAGNPIGEGGGLFEGEMIYVVYPKRAKRKSGGRAGGR